MKPSAWRSNIPNNNNPSNYNYSQQSALKTTLSKSTSSHTEIQVSTLPYSLPNNRRKRHKINKLRRRHRIPNRVWPLGDSNLRWETLDPRCHPFPQRQNQILRNHHLFPWKWVRPQRRSQIYYSFCSTNTKIWLLSLWLHGLRSI